ncbi:HAD-like domain-containing protein [Peziza echinospora]|nr:HAD-like domain-containing protein [Peziza echinospora]
MLFTPEPMAGNKTYLGQNGSTSGRGFIKQDLRVPLSSISNDNGDNTASKRDIMIFSDFDGTIFMQDTGHILFDSHGCGVQRREELDEEIKTGVRSFRDVSEEMWGSLNVPFADGFEIMKSSLEIDPAFRDFHEFCIERSIPFHIISAGLRPVLRAVLDEFLGPKQSQHIDIIANDASITPDGQWKPIWLHDTPLGHDKAASIKEYRSTASTESEDGSCPLVVFIGDGVSDLPAAREADVLFARKGLRLEEFCIENGIPYIPFSTFADIQREIRKIIRDDQKNTKGHGKPVQYNPRANFWRQLSNKGTLETLGSLALSRDNVNISSKPLMAYTTAPSSVSLVHY